VVSFHLKYIRYAWANDKNVTDSGILLSAMSGRRMTLQPRTIQRIKKYLDNLKTGTLKGLRFGVNKNF
jgi:amidase